MAMESVVVRIERVRLLDLDVACDGAMVGTAGKAE